MSTATRNHTKLHQADCHLKYAWFYLELGENEKARESWAKAQGIMNQGGYHLRDVDSHLLSVRLYIDGGDKEKAQESLVNAKETRDQMGYHRRDEDIKRVERQLLTL